LKCDVELEGFWREDYLEFIPEISGIYVVYESYFDEEEDFLDFHRIIYIGESNNLKNNLLNHPDLNTWRAGLKVKNELSFAYTACDEKDRERIKSAYVNQHKPSFNHASEFEFPFQRTVIISRGNLGLIEPVIDLEPFSAEFSDAV